MVRAVSTDPIIVATALDASGVIAVKEAVAWGKRCGAPVIVAHALPAQSGIMPLLPHLSTPLPSEELRGKAETALAEHVEEALGDADAVELALVEGSPHAAILELAGRLSPQLVVVSQSHKAALERYFLGSTAEQITRHAPCSVLIVKAERAPTGCVVAATDLSDAAVPALEAGAAEAERRGVELVAVHALDVAQPLTALFEPTATLDEDTVKKLAAAAEEMLEDTLERSGHEGRVKVVLGPPARAISELADEEGASLLVVASQGHTGFEHVVLGSVAEAAVRKSHCSVLVVRAPG